MAKGRWVTHDGRHIFLAEGDASFMDAANKYEKSQKDAAARKKQRDESVDNPTSAARNEQDRASKGAAEDRAYEASKDKMVAAARKAAGLPANLTAGKKIEMSGTGARGKKWKYSREGFDEATGGFIKHNRKAAAFKAFMKFNSKELSAEAHFRAWLNDNSGDFVS